jgi:biotin-dependent carboxylase-like uncharacterized protein
MGEAVFEVIQPGIFSTVQDLGRKGYFAVGIPPSGAMDKLALRMGNLLLKNPLGAAGIEVTAIGITLKVLRNTVIAITGGDFEAKINGDSVPNWHAIYLKKGDTLALGQAKAGWRGYICVAGGIDVPQILSSQSTYTQGGIGGVNGRPLKAGDILECSVPMVNLDTLNNRRVREAVLPVPGEENLLRVVLGPQNDYVREESVEEFLNTPYRVSPNSNRIGYRFEGPQLFFKERERSQDAGSDPSNIVDDGNAIGAIQIPGGTEPICLGPDGVSMGGYVKIACLITADMDRMAQLRLMEYANFKSVKVNEAREILKRSIALTIEDNVLT